MAELADFKDRHAGEEIICIGAGPSLKFLPPAFLESRPNIAVNLVRHWMPFLRVDHWLGLDVGTIDPEKYNALPSIEGIPQFIPLRYVHRAKLHEWGSDDLVSMVLPQVQGIPFSPSYGASYTTSLAAAAQLAGEIMGASRVLLVGFDCTRTARHSNHYHLPHFYNDPGPDNPVKYERPWDLQMQRLRTHLLDLGSDLLNLTRPTASDPELLPQSNYREFWTPPEKYEVDYGSYIFPS